MPVSNFNRSASVMDPTMIPGEKEPAIRIPAPRRGWRGAVGRIGRSLTVIGALVLGFVAFQLWGTGLHHASAQRDLRREFEEQLASTIPPPIESTSTVPSTAVTTAPASPQTNAPTTASPATSAATTNAPTTAPPSTDAPVTAAPPSSAPEPAAPPPRPEFATGDPVAHLEIPIIGVDEIVVSGVGVGELRNGPGHYPQTPLPGELGNAALAGHRTTYGAPFYDIDALMPGDEIIATTYAGRFVYRVTGAGVVEPSDVSVVAAVPGYRLTLTTCHPKYSARKRLVVTAELDVNASSPVTGAPPAQAESVPNTTIPTLAQAMAPIAAPATPTTPATTSAPSTSVISTTSPSIEADGTASRPERTSTTDDSIGAGWFDDSAAWPHVIVWGLLCLAVAAAASRLGRSTGRRWLGWFAGFVPFIVVLYFFYENVNRLVPPGL